MCVSVGWLYIVLFFPFMFLMLGGEWWLHICGEDSGSFESRDTSADVRSHTRRLAGWFYQSCASTQAGTFNTTSATWQGSKWGRNLDYFRSCFVCFSFCFFILETSLLWSGGCCGVFTLPFPEFSYQSKSLKNVFMSCSMSLILRLLLTS